MAGQDRFQAFSTAFEDTVETGRPRGLSAYAATNPAGFFAVGSEVYFEEPEPLRRENPDLPRLPRAFYTQASPRTHRAGLRPIPRYWAGRASRAAARAKSRADDGAQPRDSLSLHDMINSRITLCSLLCIAPTLTETPPPTEEKNLVETALAAGNFTTLLAAAKAAGLAETLAEGGPFTILAPSDAAFAKLPDGALDRLLLPANRPTLATILKHHVIAGEVKASEALAASRAETLAETRLRFRLEGGQFRVGAARVLKNDIASSNGIIHVIDRVLIPELDPAQAAVRTDSAALIEIAIDRGVPLFNGGQPAACAALYEIAARGLLNDPQLGEGDRSTLLSALRKTQGQHAVDAAWTLRAALDAVYTNIREPSPAPMTGTDTRKSLFEFSAANEAAAFRPLNDTVMGGRSRSRMTETGSGVAVFAGEVSLENNGGFASVRTQLADAQLAGMAGIALRVRGDGRTYRLTAQRDRATYDIDFSTRAGEWQEIKLPFAGLRRNIRGYRPGTPPPQADQITGMGILIGDKRQGPFRLEIDWIRAYRD